MVVVFLARDVMDEEDTRIPGDDCRIIDERAFVNDLPLEHKTHEIKISF